MNLKLKILVLVIISNFIYAQFDTNYVYITRKKFTTNGMFEFFNTNLKIKPYDEYYDYIQNLDSIYDVEQRFKSRNSIYLGFGVTFYRIGFSLTFLLPYSDIPELKQAPSISFMGGYSLKKFYAEFRYRNYYGFQEQRFITKEDTSYERHNLVKNTSYRQMTGILYYFFSDKYNYDAAYKNYNIQKKSTLTPYLSVGAGYVNLNGVFDDLYSPVTQKLTFNIEDYSVKTGIGIAGTVVYKHLYFSALGHFGASFNQNYIDRNGKFDKIFKIFPSLEVKAAAGINNQKYFISINYTYSNDIIYLNPSKIGVNNFYFSIKAGIKLNSILLGKARHYL